MSETIVTFTPYADLRYPDLTPLEGDDAGRVLMNISGEDSEKIGRGPLWSAVVTDTITGRTFRVEGAPCSLPTCFCAARIVEEII